MGRGGGGGKGEEWGLKKEKTFTFLQEKGIYSFKAFGCIFSSAISSFAESLSLPFSHPFILPVILHIPRLLLCSVQQRRPEMKPLRWIMYPQSKCLESGLAIVRVWKERKHFYVNVKLPHWVLLRSDHWPLWTKKQSANSNQLMFFFNMYV